MSEDTTEQSAQRRAKLAELRARGQAYPNDFRPDARAGELHERFAGTDAEALEREPVAVAVAGRMMTRRVMGKAGFAHLRDVSGDIQVYVRRDDLPQGQYAEFKRFDLGDIVAVEGEVFRTRTNELSVKARSVRLLVKSLLPLPEKYHGLADVETRYRRRYVDLIVNERSPRGVPRALAHRGPYPPILHRPRLPGSRDSDDAPDSGRGGRPAFVTHHNALDTDLYLRVAPELYLKRLVVGGFERVFEINRNFRNEGVSTQHNPEFTMLEFYQAYADYVEMMDLTEDLVRGAALAVCGSARIEYQGEAIDLVAPFRKLSMADAILECNPGLDPADLDRDDRVRAYAESLGVAVESHHGRGKLWQEIFEKTAQDTLRQPTFITAHPMEVSPLSRANDENPFLTDRFELFIAGKEIDQRLLRAERPRGSGGPVPPPGRDPRRRRRRGDVVRRGLHPGAGVRPAADRRAGARHRPSRDAAHGLRVHPRRAALPVHAARAIVRPGVVE